MLRSVDNKKEPTATCSLNWQTFNAQRMLELHWYESQLCCTMLEYDIKTNWLHQFFSRFCSFQNIFLIGHCWQRILKLKAAYEIQIMEVSLCVLLIEPCLKTLCSLANNFVQTSLRRIYSSRKFSVIWTTLLVLRERTRSFRAVEERSYTTIVK